MLRDDGQDDGACAASSQHDCDGEASASIEPCEDGPRVGELRGAVSYDSYDEVRRIELRDMATKEGQGGDSTGEHNNARENDSSRRKAVEETTDGGRAGGYGECGDCEGSRDGFALPSEGVVQGGEKQAEGEGHDAGEADHHSDESGEGDSPAGVG